MYIFYVKNIQYCTVPEYSEYSIRNTTYLAMVSMLKKMLIKWLDDVIARWLPGESHSLRCSLIELEII